MPTTVYKSEEITLENGMTFTGKPLKIARLRKFMDEFTKLQGIEGDDSSKETFDIFGRLVLICLEAWNPEIADLEYIEDNFDMDNYHDVIRAASGIDLRDQGNV